MKKFLDAHTSDIFGMVLVVLYIVAASLAIPYSGWILFVAILYMLC